METTASGAISLALLLLVLLLAWSLGASCGGRGADVVQMNEKKVVGAANYAQVLEAYPECPAEPPPPAAPASCSREEWTWYIDKDVPPPTTVGPATSGPSTSGPATSGPATSATITGFWLGQSPISTQVSFSMSESARKWMLSFPGEVISDISLTALSKKASVPVCQQPVYEKYILTQGGGNTTWNKDIYTQLTAQASSSALHAGWDGICYDWEYLDPSESWDDHVTYFNKMTEATKNAGLLCIVTSLGMGPAPAWGPDPLPSAADLTGIDWSHVDYFVPQLYYKPPQQNYGFTAADTRNDPQAPLWMKKEADKMNIDYMVNWWRDAGVNGHKIEITSRGTVRSYGDWGSGQISEFMQANASTPQNNRARVISNGRFMVLRGMMKGLGTKPHVWRQSS